MFQIIPFTLVTGSDEREYCFSGFDLSVGVCYTSVEDHLPEYHTFLYDKSSISFSDRRDNVRILLQIVISFEANVQSKNLVMFGEPMLGSHGQYPTIGSQKMREISLDRIMWLLNYSDGKHDLFDIAEKAGCSIHKVSEVAINLKETSLLCVV